MLFSAMKNSKAGVDKEGIDIKQVVEMIVKVKTSKSITNKNYTAKAFLILTVS